MKWQNEISSPIDTHAGVLQGAISSPKLFNDYISDIGDYLNKDHGIVIKDEVITHILYADDMVLCSKQMGFKDF